MANISLFSKLPQVGTTIFTQMSQLAIEHQAINLSQGFPDYPIALELQNLASFYQSQGYDQYAPMTGAAPLRMRLQALFQEWYQQDYDANDCVTIYAGASEAIFNSVAALIRPGDEVIIFEPAYDLYAPVIQLFGGIAIPIVLEAPSFNIDWDFVKNKISSKTKAFIFNNPNNPTGKVYSKEDLQHLADCVNDTDIIIISDEVYANIVFEPHTFTSICQISTLKDRSIIVGSFGKLLHATGWKIGYTMAPSYITKVLRKVHQYNTFCVNHALQMAIADYLKFPNAYLDLPQFFKNKRDLMIDSLSGTDFKTLSTSGTYFILVQPPNPMQLSDFDLAKHFITHHKVATIPMSAFYKENSHSGLLRICFAKKDSTLISAINNLLNSHI